MNRRLSAFGIVLLTGGLVFWISRAPRSGGPAQPEGSKEPAQVAAVGAAPGAAPPDVGASPDPMGGGLMQALSRLDGGDSDEQPMDDLSGLFGGLVRDVSRGVDEVVKPALFDLERVVVGTPGLEHRRAFGSEFNAYVMSQARRVEDEQLTRAFELLGRQVLAAAREELGETFSGLEYTFILLDDPAVNAFAHEGGYVYVNTGLLGLLETLDQLRFVIAHEIGHVERCHTCSAVALAQRNILTDMVGHEALAAAYGMVSLNYGSARELEADAFGFAVGRRLGIKPDEMRRAFELLATVGPGEEDVPLSDGPVAIVEQAVTDHFRTHPRAPRRIEQISRLEQSAR